MVSPKEDERALIPNVQILIELLMINLFDQRDPREKFFVSSPIENMATINDEAEAFQ